MRGGPAVGSTTTNALIDSVRQAAYDQMLAHLGIADAPPRLELVIRSWISLAESTALIWLDGRRIPRAELEVQLVHDFAALVAVSAVQDEGMADVLRAMLKDEPADGPSRSSSAGCPPCFPASLGLSFGSAPSTRVTNVPGQHT